MSANWIPLYQIYMRNGINIAGFAYRLYTANTTWELHLHAGGGIVSLRNRDMRQTFYTSTTNVESCDGMPEISSGASDPATTPQRISQPSPGLVPNQERIQVDAQPIVAANPATMLEDAPPTTITTTVISKAQQDAKAAHFAPVETKPDEAANAYKSLNVPKPAKRRPGRPRKVIAEEAAVNP